jgi:hypothetical protein
MLIEEITSGIEEKRAWKRSGTQIKMKYRCSGGTRNGRVVSSPSQCSSPVDIGKSTKMKSTKAARSKSMSRKAKRTKRLNPTAKRSRKMNK